MVHSIGIDLVEIKRIEKSVKKYGRRFVARILGTEELNAFNSRHDQVAYLAGRFAAKEAVIKSLGRLLKSRPGYSTIQILNDTAGHPFLSGQAEVAALFTHRQCLLSISHERHYAAAVAIITERT